MDDITTRTIVIAVNIFVTIAILSLLMIMFFQMQGIYGKVVKTDTSIYNKFDNIYSMYNGKIETGIGLLNTLKKYENENEQQIVIVYPDSDKIERYIADENLGRAENEQIREATYLKELMKEEKKHTPGGTHKFRLENKYTIAVYNNEETQKITISFQSIN